MSITDEQLKGNWAEQYVAANLASKGCFVRHVNQGHDCGIDLYCEKIEAGNPYLHFWCQVKCTKHWGDPKKLRNMLKEKHIQYWLAQPVPVYIFFVADMRDARYPPYFICKTIDIMLVGAQAPPPLLEITKPSELTAFLNGHLPCDTFLWELMNGKVTCLKKPKPEYIKHIPRGVSEKFEPSLRQSLLSSLYTLSDDILLQGADALRVLEADGIAVCSPDRLANAGPYVKALEILAREKDKDNHYHYYKVVGIYFEFVGQYMRALSSYARSLAILQRDPESKKPGSVWEGEIDELSRHFARVKGKAERRAPLHKKLKKLLGKLGVVETNGEQSDGMGSRLLHKLEVLDASGRHGQLLKKLFSDAENFDSYAFEIAFAYDLESRGCPVEYELKPSLIDFRHEIEEGQAVSFELRLLKERQEITEERDAQLACQGSYTISGDTEDEIKDTVRLQGAILEKCEKRGENPAEGDNGTYYFVVISVSDTYFGSVDMHDCILAVQGAPAVRAPFRLPIFGLCQELTAGCPAGAPEFYDKFQCFRENVHGVLFARNKDGKADIPPTNLELEYLLVANTSLLSESELGTLKSKLGFLFEGWAQRD